jgi:phosphopantothenoylcysteine decarboxylase/phosphopantothenate--cysteine ligase
MARILLGVSAGIAIYKSADLASKLTQRGDEVRTIMTGHALKFMTPLAFRAVTLQPVYTDTFQDDPAYRPEHISLPEWGDLLLLAPATADLIGRIRAGLGDDLLTLTVLACQKPVLFAPAMNDRMWANPIVQQNIKQLKDLGYHFMEPDAGHLACGSVGPGRLPEVGNLMAAIDGVLTGSSKGS